MFGYIRPLKGELKVREFERFKACYCGLCHALGKNYGLSARFILNFELVFLAMLIWDENDTPVIKRGRCIASPCRKKRFCTGNSALDTAAGYSVILSWWKIKDAIADEKFIKTIPHRAAAVLLCRAYKKAASDFPEFNSKVSAQLKSLAEYESSGGESFDSAADKFARILSSVLPEDMPESHRRPLAELLYHTGRWIYLVDAYDDYSDDVESGRYNALLRRFPPEDGKFPKSGVKSLESTLIHSNNLISAAFELMPQNPWTQTVENTIYLGMPDALERVLNGTWLHTKRSQIATDKE
ncbi:MAG: DUF5685 family protein [Oscillospiraceae bacterium]|nr:DUF5685 family protein [Oscillospiraceae bacterium]